MSKHTVEELLRGNSAAQTQVLEGLSNEQQARLIEQLCEDFLHQHRLSLRKWGLLTGQSAQLDTGYIAQHIASILLRTPGQGFRGKGDDLIDKSEVKAASALAGVDRARWNHGFGTIAQEDRQRERAKDKKDLDWIPKWKRYQCLPTVVYVLLDLVEGDGNETLRLRTWCVFPESDQVWQKLLGDFIALYEPGGPRKSTTERNLQLHPPIGQEHSLVTNDVTSLDLSANLAFNAHIAVTSDGDVNVDWKKPIEDFLQTPMVKEADKPEKGSTARDVPDVQEVDPDRLLQMFNLFSGEELKALRDPLAEAEVGQPHEA